MTRKPQLDPRYRVGANYTGKRWCAYFGDDLIEFIRQAGTDKIGIGDTYEEAAKDLMKIWNIPSCHLYFPQH